MAKQWGGTFPNRHGCSEKQFIMFFESNIDSNENENAGATILAFISVIYGTISLLNFLNHSFESYIEIIEVHPFNGGKRLIKFLARWKQLMMFIMLTGLVILNIVQIGDDARQRDCLSNLKEEGIFGGYGGYGYANNISDSMMKKVECPCACVTKDCYSEDCESNDKFRRLTCSLHNATGLEYCGKVYKLR